MVDHTTQSSNGWPAFGRSLREHLAAAEGTALRSAIRKHLVPLEVLLGDHPSLPELARALAQQPIEDWRSVWSGSTQEDSAARVVESWRLLVRLWEHIEDEIDGETDPEHAWAGFHEELGRVLGALHHQGRELWLGSKAIEPVLSSLPPDTTSTWPLEYAGTIHAFQSSWRAEAAERLGAAPEDLPGLDALEDGPLFTLHPAAQALADLAAWMHERAAWAEVLRELGPLLAASQAR